MNSESQEVFYPLGDDIYLTKCEFNGEEYFHVRKFIFINNSVRPTKTGIVLKHKNIRCLKNFLNRLFSEPTEQTRPKTVPNITDCVKSSEIAVKAIPDFVKADVGIPNFCSEDDNELVKAAIDAERRMNLESRFYH